MSKKTKKPNWPRPIMQWGVILAIVIIALIPRFNESFVPDFEAYCPFGGIQALGSYLLNQALSCTMTSAQIVMGVLLMLAVFVLSKLFCAYICPVGTVSEWFGKLGDKLKIRITIKGIADKILRSLKYILLFITLYFTFQSNELFCKKFDPYYAIASGFDTDVVILYAVIGIVLVILGSVFIRLLWCKYICPLGAVSNIFKFTGFFVAVMAVYLLLRKLDVEISYIWPLAVACVGGYMIEITGLFGKLFPLVKITRHEDTCTSCQLCSRKCPQAIDVAGMKVVREADCNLCSECIAVCPEKNTLQINRQKSLRWLPPVATILLVITGLFLGGLWEVPTIDEKWYGEEEMANARIFSQSGLKNIKCYGSSMAFASKMKEVDGVLGVATFVKHQRVKVYYDPSKLNDTKIQELLFTPSGILLRTLKRGIPEVQIVQVWLENFFDLHDCNYLSRLLLDKTEALYVSSEYDCPVMVKIYFPGNVKISEPALLDILESETLSYSVNENNYTVKLGYKIAKGPIYTTIRTTKYIVDVFEPYEAQFNHFEKYDPLVIKVYEVPFGRNKSSWNKLSYLVSHLSNDEGIIEFRTFLNDSLEETVAISYVDTMTSIHAVYEKLTSDTLRFTYSSGKDGKVANMFDFKTETRGER
ncbi:MAG: 4Fe-4S binding protein [Prolixibacteraceae bacterium]|jgi:NAD-dependent dihydropyrimidine dehydrogenase PreA subunit|nr:4Fe-4S binding protein [Prolixibacteraceae bacterium]